MGLTNQSTRLISREFAKWIDIANVGGADQIIGFSAALSV